MFLQKNDNKFQVSKIIGQNKHSILPYKHRKTTISEIWRENETY